MTHTLSSLQVAYAATIRVIATGEREQKIAHLVANRDFYLRRVCTRPTFFKRYDNEALDVLLVSLLMDLELSIKTERNQPMGDGYTPYQQGVQNGLIAVKGEEDLRERAYRESLSPLARMGYGLGWQDGFAQQQRDAKQARLAEEAYDAHEWQAFVASTMQEASEAWEEYGREGQAEDISRCDYCRQHHEFSAICAEQAALADQVERLLKAPLCDEAECLRLGKAIQPTLTDLADAGRVCCFFLTDVMKWQAYHREHLTHV